MRPEERLSPCPFCGERDKLYPAYRYTEHRYMGRGEPCSIGCWGCGMDFTPREGIDVIAAWNRRSPTPEHGGREGFVLVPREPTEAMVAAALVCDGIVLEDAEEDGEPDETTVYPARIYRAMLSASLGGGEGSSVADSGGTPRLRVGEAKSEGQCKSEGE